MGRAVNCEVFTPRLSDEAWLDDERSAGQDLPAYEPAPCDSCPQRTSCATECGRFQQYVATGRDPGPGATFTGGRPLKPGALARRRQAGIPEHLVELPVRVIAQRLGLPRTKVQQAVDQGRPLAPP